MPDPVDDEPPPRPRDWGDDDADRRRREDRDDDYDRPSRRRSRSAYYEHPHRGGLILTLGIMSVVMCNCLPPAGVGLGAAAWVMANGDLAAMDAGEMDPAGRSNTNAGRICGLVGGIGNTLYTALLVVMIAVEVAML